MAGHLQQKFRRLPQVRYLRHPLNAPLNAIAEELSPLAQRAFLVVRRGGRWTDVLRLAPDRPAVIGRASSNSIAIRSHQASRRHAEIRWDGGRWWLRDLGSRNGTLLGGIAIAQDARPLADGDQIEIAGCTLSFVTQISDALAGPPLRAAGATSAAATDDQLTLQGGTAPQITHRLHESHYLSDTSRSGGTASPDDGWPSLFRLAYRVASCQTVEQAAELTLESLMAAVPGGFGGVFLGGGSAAQPELVTFLAPEHRSYRRPAPAMVQSLCSGTQPILIRNLADDGELQVADSRGELSAQSALLAPIVLPSSEDAGGLSGYLHLYTVDVATELTRGQLELATAAAGVLGAAVENLRQHGRLVRSLRRSRRTVDSLRQRLDESVRIIGASPPIRRLKQVISRVAATDTTVLVRGESGVGKELVAGAIHQGSPRHDGPLICLNCAALSPTLLESELFGHEKGAFTGATEQKKGKFEAADGGTLMLDEIGEMDINLQAKLLRVLEGHRFERLGGQLPLRVDVRLIAATNRDLAAEVAAGRFRSDLFYRLNVVEIVVPPLRDRGEDILKLAEHYVGYFADKTARVIEGLTPRARAALTAHRWPGNVRELKNVIERAVVLGNEALIDAEDLGFPIARGGTVGDAGGERAAALAAGAATDPAHHAVVQPPHAVAETGSPAPTAGENRRPLSLAELERRHLVDVLRGTDGNKSRAAAILGIERSTLDRKLKRYDVGPEAYRR